MPIKILVVDDEPDLELLITQKFRKKVRKNEYHFIFAHNGVEALKKLQDTEVDIVLTDINMPEMDGLTLLAQLTQHYPLLKSVIISAYGDMGNIRTALNRGAFDFLTKPIDFEDLEITIAKTVNEVTILKQAVLDREELNSIQKEMDIARKIQSSMVPSDFPAFPDRSDFDVFAKMVPAKNVGGDFYDYFLVDEENLYFVIGDVSGKGVPAALFMAVCRTLFKAQALKGLQPDQCLYEVNKLICLENPYSMFVTIFCGMLNTKTGEIVYSSGGHNIPYIIRSKGTIEPFDNTASIALGVLEDAIYYSKKVILKSGDGFYLYTDGVTEAMDKADNLYSEERLENYLKKEASSCPEDIIKGTFKELELFSQGAQQADDITTLAIKYIGS